MQNHEALLNAAWQHFQNDEFNQALKILTRVVSEDNQNGEAWEMAGTCNYMIKDFEAASMSFELARKNGRKDDTFAHLLGECYFELNHFPEAIDAFLRALEVDPKSTRVLIKLAQCYAIQQDFESSAIYLKRAKKSKPDSQQKATMKTVEALNYLNRGYNSWSVVNSENVRTPASRKEYTIARKMYRRSLKLGCTEKWLQTRQKEMHNRLMNNRKRVFVGSWMTLFFSLVLVFFFTGGIKGCSAERHLGILKSEAAISASVVAKGAGDLFKNGNLDETREMLHSESYRTRRAESASIWYRLGILWVIAFILYLLTARAPLYLVQTRRYRLVKPPKSASPADYLRPDMAAAPGVQASESTETSYEKRHKNILVASGWALLYALLLPLMVIVEFFRNFILYI